jgi:hypothetical protein
MGEIEALIRRRDMLLERISKMNNEIEKLDGRLAFLGWTMEPERIEIFDVPKMFVQEMA